MRPAEFWIRSAWILLKPNALVQLMQGCQLADNSAADCLINLWGI
jgi:hypothetical protein